MPSTSLYTHLLKHCSTDNQGPVKMFDAETQLMITLTICRHALDLKFMAFVLKCSESTVQRIFTRLDNICCYSI